MASASLKLRATYHSQASLPATSFYQVLHMDSLVLAMPLASCLNQGQHSRSPAQDLVPCSYQERRMGFLAQHLVPYSCRERHTGSPELLHVPCSFQERHMDSLETVQRLLRTKSALINVRQRYRWLLETHITIS